MEQNRCLEAKLSDNGARFRTVWRWGAAIISAVLLGTCGTAAAKDTEVHVAVAAHAFSALPLFTAEANGYFADEGLDVKIDYFGGGPPAVASLLGGSSQFLYGALVDNIKAIHRGLPLVVTMAGLSKLTVGLVIRKDIANKLGHKPTVKDLKGLRIGTLGRGGFTDLATRYILKVNGINPNTQATLIPIHGPPRQLAAGKAKAVDANMLSDPFPIIAVYGLHAWTYVLNLTTDQGPPLFRNFGFSMVETTRGYVAKHRPVVEKMVKAMVRAENFIGDPKNVNALVKILMKQFPRAHAAVFRKELEMSASAYRPEVTPSMIKKNIELLRATGQVKGAMPTYDQVVDTSFEPLWKAYRH